MLGRTAPRHGCDCRGAEPGEALLLLHALQVGTVAGVNQHEFALVDEQGHANLNTSLERSGLQGVGGGVARVVFTGISA